MSKLKTIGKFLLRYSTPFPTLRRQVGEIRGSVERTAERIRLAREAVKNGTKPQPEAPRLPKDPRAAFEALAAERGLTDSAWRAHAGRLRVTKFIWLAAALMSLGAGLYIAATLATWITGIVGIMLAFGGLVFAAKAMHLAYYEHQVVNRSLHDWKTFVGSPDFFRYLLT